MTLTRVPVCVLLRIFLITDIAGNSGFTRPLEPSKPIEATELLIGSIARTVILVTRLPCENKRPTEGSSTKAVVGPLIGDSEPLNKVDTPRVTSIDVLLLSKGGVTSLVTGGVADIVDGIPSTLLTAQRPVIATVGPVQREASISVTSTVRIEALGRPVDALPVGVVRLATERCCLTSVSNGSAVRSRPIGWTIQRLIPP